MVTKMQRTVERHKINQKKLKGSFTIEAAIIMPVVIIITLMLIYLGFFLYNRCVMTQKSYVAALRGSIYDEERKENILARDQYMEEELRELYGTKLLAGAGVESHIAMEKKEVTVKTELFMRVPIVTLLKNQGYKNGWNIYIEKKVPVFKEIQFIRNCRKLERVIGEGN